MVAVVIKSSGQAISDKYELLYIEVKTTYNRVPYAELGFIGGDIAKQDFKISESGDFEPGKELSIELGYYDRGPSGKTKEIFKGIVMKQNLRLKGNGCLLIVELNDAAVKMTITRSSAVYENMKDSAIISKLISGSGLRAGTVSSTAVQHKKMVQYACTPWDFMLSRAEANGLLVSVKSGAVSAMYPSLTGRAKAGFIVGVDEVYDFEMEADARHQYASVESSNWDVKGKKAAPAKKAKTFSLDQGNFKPDKIGKSIGGNAETLFSMVSLDEGETQAWSDAVMMKRRLSFLRGQFRVPGSTSLEVGDLFTLGGVGDRFSGKTLVTGVHHSYSIGEWFTNIQFGLAYDWFTTRPGVSEMPAAGLLPVINGLQIGLVEAFEADPDKQFRVKVSVPAISGPNSVLWARLTTLTAGKDAGTFFQPEPGDEVILGFLNDDPRQPVILGAVHSSGNAAPLKPADKNPQKGIITKSGIKMLLDDDKKTFTIQTSDKNILTINDKDKLVEIKDANQNILQMSSDGITLDSGKDIIIKSKGAIKMTASGKVEIKGAAIDIT